MKKSQNLSIEQVEGEKIEKRLTKKQLAERAEYTNYLLQKKKAFAKTN